MEEGLGYRWKGQVQGIGAGEGYRWEVFGHLSYLFVPRCDFGEYMSLFVCGDTVVDKGSCGVVVVCCRLFYSISVVL